MAGSRLLRTVLLRVAAFGWYNAVRPLTFRVEAQRAHNALIEILRRADDFPALPALIHRLTFTPAPVTVGGVRLPAPLICAAGFVKGDGFTSEAEATAAVEAGRNIIPGWRAVPALLGAVEFGSFTRCPRPGNPGQVLWRDVPTRSTQNRIGLKNPGVVAAARFLSQRPLPEVFGINIAVTPGVTDPIQERQEVVEAAKTFLECGVHPAWFTLNLSCPNTEDDPTGNQTEAKARDLCAALIAELGEIPLWVKLGPDLADEQYRVLLRAFHEVGVRAVIATNTQAAPAPDGSGALAGVGGGRLHERALAVTRLLADEVRTQGYAIDVIGGGGVQNLPTFLAFQQQGAKAVQVYSGLIYASPLFVAQILNEWVGE